MISGTGSFSIARLPAILFGRGVFDRTADIAASFGKHVLLVTGERSFVDSPAWERLLQAFARLGIRHQHVRVAGEPSPQMVDDAVRDFSGADIDVVVGIGGGSAMDAAKAIAGLLRVGRSVMDYLEGVGPELTYRGPAVPFIAVPTTAGTGSEATKNAVLSRAGKDGFKKSFRDEQLVARSAIVDPDLLAGCPPSVIAANGMDALTQLIESYVSLNANPFNDALGISGLHAARDGLIALYRSAGADATARERMAYASLVSGINLAQTGLGSVHGLASPLGAFYPIPHGVVCGTLVAVATRVNVRAMREREPHNPALRRYAKVAEILLQRQFDNVDQALDALVGLLQQWTEALDLERLAAYGLGDVGLDQVVAHARGSSMKTNPIVLTDAEIRMVLQERM